MPSGKRNNHIRETRSIEYKGGYKYQLLINCSFNTGITHPHKSGLRILDKSKKQGKQAPSWIYLAPNGLLKIKIGYAWDGASGPAIDTKTNMRGSLVHDALYQLMREKKLELTYRKQADKLFEKICRQDGVNWLRCQILYLGVRLLGWIFARPQKSRKGMEKAP